MTDEIKKTSDQMPEVEDTSTGTAADVEEIMKKYDRESNTRIWTGTPGMIIKFTMAAFALFMIWLNLFANWDERIRRCLFLGTIIVFAFVMYPMRKGDTSRVNHMPFYDVILMLLGAGSFFYYIINFKAIIDQATRIHQTEIILGIIGMIILAEACRRVVGLPILFVAGFFVIYSFAQGKVLRVIVYNLFYTTTGVIGTPIGVCSTYIVLFIIFGAFLEGTGISDFFIQVANSIAGASKGGPAKVAVISSALCGMVSGSSVANTVTTGSVTIPLMKKTGYRSEFAGAVEASASTGGQIMPPIMGAAAFLMSEMVGVPYADIAVKAILPAFLYFLGIFIAVHLEALRTGLKGLKKEDLPKFGKLVLKQGYLLLPLIVLVWMVMNGFTMARAAVIATLVAIVVSMFRKETRLTPMGFVNVLENGTKNTISVAIACGVAGVIAGVVTMTGLGQVLISAIVGLANGHLIIALLLTMVTCIVLGMGVPTTANYIIMATTCAPILVSGMGVNAIAANMFVFYFGIIADITPPVALAAYAGSAIARSNPMKTAFTATRLAIAAFIVPYIFVMSPALLFIETTPMEIITIVITSVVGLFGVSAGLAGFIYTKMPIWQRVLSVVGGLMLIYPGIVTDIGGVGLVGVVLALQYLSGKKNKAQAMA